MTTEQVHLRIEQSLLERLGKNAQRQGFPTIQRYITDVLHHAVYSKKHRGGRPLKEGFDDRIARMIARPTKESRKRVAWAKRSGLWR